jgi:hypothetical protein
MFRLVSLGEPRFPLSLRNIEDQLHDRGVDVSYEAVWHKYGPKFASEIKKFFFTAKDRFWDHSASFCYKVQALFDVSTRREVSNPIDMAVVSLSFVNYFLTEL